jgi:hypothetical protein
MKFDEFRRFSQVSRALAEGCFVNESKRMKAFGSETLSKVLQGEKLRAIT